MKVTPSIVDKEVRHALTSLDEEETFAEFYRREFAGQVRRAALLTGSVELAHDLVHDVFVEMFRRWGTVDVVGSYLNQAVLNRCRDVGRRRRRTSAVFIVESAAPDHDPLWDAPRRLPFNHRAAVVLRYYHQLTEADIATQLGCRRGSVGPWIQRGLRSLRKELS